MNPIDALKAFRDLESKKMIGIHFGTFKLTDEGYLDPIKTLKKEIETMNLDRSKILTPVFGKAYQI